MTEKYKVALSPFLYKGSKTRLLHYIMSLFPKNYPSLHYVEPFGGSGIILLNKKPSDMESFNDIDDNVFNFFNIIKTRCSDLIKKTETNLPSESEFNRCHEILKNKDSDKLDKAYAFFLTQTSGFSGLNTSWGFIRKDKREPAYFQKQRLFNILANRMKRVQLFNRPAERIIKNLDSKTALFYLDPPYPETTKFYNYNYTISDFFNLINILKNVKGKFILSCYKKNIKSLPFHWKVIKKTLDFAHGMQANKNADRKREELIIKNF